MANLGMYVNLVIWAANMKLKDFFSRVHLANLISYSKYVIT